MDVTAIRAVDVTARGAAQLVNPLKMVGAGTVSVADDDLAVVVNVTGTSGAGLRHKLAPLCDAALSLLSRYLAPRVCAPA